MKKVTIIGGGLSGMTAAYELSKNLDYEITLLESSDRLGGRLRSVNVNGVDIDVGGFIIAKWYKNFKDLVRELGIENEYRPFNPVFGFLLIGKNIKSFQTNIIGRGTSLKRILYLLFLTVPFAYSFKKRFYEPDGKGETTYKIFRKAFFRRNLIYRFVDAFFTGFTYQTGNKLPYISAMAFLEMMLFKGGMEVSGNLAPTTKLTNALINAIQKQGVKVKLDTTVVDFASKKVVISGGEELESDLIIVATPHIKKMSDRLGINKIDSTHYYTIIFEVEEGVVLKNDSWAGVFAEPLYKNYEISSIVNLKWMTFDKLDNRFLLAYLKSESTTELESVKLNIILRNEFKRYFPNAKIKKIHSITFFKENMPIISIKDIKRIRSLQGKDKIFYTGDYLSFPTMESAIYNGKKVAEMISS